MKKQVVVVCIIWLGMAATCEHVGIRLLALIDLGSPIQYFQSFRDCEFGNTTIAVPLDSSPGQGIVGQARVLIYDCESNKLLQVVEFTTDDGCGIKQIIDEDSYYIVYENGGYLYTKEKGLTNVGMDECMTYFEAHPPRWRPHGGYRFNYTTPKGTKYARFPAGWVEDLVADDTLLSRLSMEENSHMDWELLNNTYVALSDPWGDQGNVTSMMTYDFRNLNGEVLFKIPYAMAPGGNDDQGITAGNKVGISNDGKRLFISAHGYTQSLFPEAKENYRKQFIWVYDIVNSQEWNVIKDRKAHYVVLKSDMTGVKESKEIDATRLSIEPGKRKLYGLFGELTEDNINLRDKPSIKGKVLQLMNSQSVALSSFMIIDRTEQKDKVGNLEDYWYNIVYEQDEKITGWVFGAYVRFKDKLASGVETIR